MENKAKEWHVRVYKLAFNEPRKLHYDKPCRTFEEAQREHRSASHHVAVLNSLTVRDETYYLEPLVHCCSQTYSEEV